MRDQVRDSIRYMEKNVVLETLKLTEEMGQTASHLSVISVISALGWS